jgi:HEAT repeat protein
MPVAAKVLAILAVMLVSLVAYGAHNGTLEAAWEVLTGHQIEIKGEPVPATHAVLSEHEREWILKQPPQEQAERLMQAAINHDAGATDLIFERVAGWYGHIRRTKNWDALELTARYSNDVRVRAAAVEIDLAVYNTPKTEEAALHLMEAADENPSARPLNAYILGMLANRGVETERIHEWLVKNAHGDDQQTRYWSVEGLAFIGTDETIQDFIEILRNDPSMDVRERAGCSLAKSGMLTREQRMKAVPGLLKLTDDPAINDTTRNWVYQALREITNEGLPNDPATWRNWYDKYGAERSAQFHAQANDVLGNN